MVQVRAQQYLFSKTLIKRKRGAEILAEVVGYVMSSDASDIAMPSKQGAARAIKGALNDADLTQRT